MNVDAAALPAMHPARSPASIIRDPKALWQLARDSFSAWVDDYAPSMGAAISYYTVFSIAPLLLIVIAVAGLVLGTDAASGRIFSELEGLIGDEGATAIQGMVESASSTGKGVFGTIAGVVTLLIGATTVFNELQSALDRIWRAPAAAKPSGIWGLVRARFLSFGLILGLGFLLLVSLIASAALSALGSWYAPVFGGWELLLQVVNFVVSLAIITVLFAAIYKWLPSVKITWRDVWVGAAVTAVLFEIGKTLIGLYIGKSGVVSGFGAAGSLVVVLLWVYYSAQIFLLGAEFTWLYVYRYGSHQGETPPDAKAQQATPAKSDDGAHEAGTSSHGADDRSSDRSDRDPPDVVMQPAARRQLAKALTADKVWFAGATLAGALAAQAVLTVVERRRRRRPGLRLFG
jgi:membrane protein